MSKHGGVELVEGNGSSRGKTGKNVTSDGNGLGNGKCSGEVMGGGALLSDNAVDECVCDSEHVLVVIPFSTAPFLSWELGESFRCTLDNPCQLCSSVLCCNTGAQ